MVIRNPSKSAIDIPTHAAAMPCNHEHSRLQPQRLLGQHFIGEPAAALEFLDVGDRCAGNVLQGLSCEERRVRADEHIGI